MNPEEQTSGVAVLTRDQETTSPQDPLTVARQNLIRNARPGEANQSAGGATSPNGESTGIGQVNTPELTDRTAQLINAAANPTTPSVAHIAPSTESLVPQGSDSGGIMDARSTNPNAPQESVVSAAPTETQSAQKEGIIRQALRAIHIIK